MKNYRHQKIMEIIQHKEVETQEELAELLKEAGFPVTQATISRDIKQLNLRKAQALSGRQCYCAGGSLQPERGDRFVGILKAGLISMEAAQNILVIKTVSGMAMAVAAAIDAIPMPGMLGSIAGDDTIMCAIRTSDEVPGIIAAIEKLIED